MCYHKAAKSKGNEPISPQLGAIRRQGGLPFSFDGENIECSLFTIGLIMLDKIDVTPPAAFAAVMELSESVSPNRG